MDRDLPGSPDLDLVREVRAGRIAAVDRFVERMRCIPRILAAKNARRTRPLPHDELADVAQEVFAAVWGRLDSFRGSASLETWVYTFCILILVRAARRRAHPMRRIGGAGEADLLAAPPVDALAERFDEERVHVALANLDPGEAEIIELKQFGDLTFEEIAARLEISPNTAKTRYYRGLASLRERLMPHFKEAAR